MSLDSFQFHGIYSSGTSGAFSQLIFFSQFDNELFFNVKQNITTIVDDIFGFQTVFFNTMHIKKAQNPVWYFRFLSVEYFSPIF